MLEEKLKEWRQRLDRVGQNVDERLNAYLQTKRGRAAAASVLGLSALMLGYQITTQPEEPVQIRVVQVTPHYEQTEEDKALRYPIVSHTTDARTTADYRKCAFIVDNMGDTVDAHPPYVYDRRLKAYNFRYHEGSDEMEVTGQFNVVLYNFNEACRTFPPEIMKEYDFAFDGGIPQDTIRIMDTLAQADGSVLGFRIFDRGLIGFGSEDVDAEATYHGLISRVAKTFPVIYSPDLLNNKPVIVDFKPAPTKEPTPQKFST